jgi:serine/threonine-protein kinase
MARLAGRYSVSAELGRGGSATVYCGRLLGPGGFSRIVAIKRLHAQYANDPAFSKMFLDEARVAARIRHPNVVATLDVVAEDGEVSLVMEYVEGESLARLLRTVSSRGERIPPRVCASIAVGALRGLHAAHEARDEQGQPLEIIHRDVSPQNVLVGADGIARVLDFGIAKALGRLQTVTREGEIKGKLGYMAPEQLRGRPLTRSADLYATSVVLWEALTARKLFAGDTDAIMAARLVENPVEPPSAHAPDVSPELDATVMRGLARDPADRFQDAAEMAAALEQSIGPSSLAEVGEWVRQTARDGLDQRAAAIAAIERGVDDGPVTAVARVHVDDVVPSAPRAASSRRTWLLAAPAALALVACAGVVIGWPSRAPERPVHAMPSGEPSAAPPSLVASVPSSPEPSVEPSPAASKPRETAPVVGASRHVRRPPAPKPTSAFDRIGGRQ